MKKMTIFHIAVIDEYKRNQKMIEAYKQEISKYPKGSIQKKGKYCYLCYRENGKIIKKYIKMQNVLQIKKQIEERKKNEEILKRLNEEKKELEYMLKYSKWRNPYE